MTLVQPGFAPLAYSFPPPQAQMYGGLIGHMAPGNFGLQIGTSVLTSTLTQHLASQGYFGIASMGQTFGASPHAWLPGTTMPTMPMPLPMPAPFVVRDNGSAPEEVGAPKAAAPVSGNEDDREGALLLNFFRQSATASL
jgi:hypothetical protein